jgi:hypothetical protein
MFKKNTAVTGFTFGMVSATDGSDIATGTPVGYFTLDGGTQTVIGDVTPVYEGNGQWSFDLLAAEMNGDIVGLVFTHASAITVHFTIKTDTKVVSELNDAITAPTAVQNRSEMDSGSTQLSTIAGDVVNIDGIVPAAAGDLMGLSAGAITAAKFAANAIDAAALATDAVDEIVDGVWDETLTGSNHNGASSAGRRLRQVDAGFIIHEGTADAGSTSTTINLETGVADAVTNEIYAGDRVTITAGTGAGEHGLILSYDASTQIATMSKAWAITPDDTSEYILVPADCDVELWNDNTVTGDGDWAAQKAETALIVADTNELQQDDVPTLISNLDAVVDTVKAETALIVADTNELQTDWLNGGRLDLILDIIAADTTTDIPALISALNDISSANVLTQVNAALDTSISELGVTAPAATPSIRTGIMLPYMALRNKRLTDANQDDIFNDAGTVICSAVLSDDTLEFIKQEYI